MTLCINYSEGLRPSDSLHGLSRAVCRLAPVPVARFAALARVFLARGASPLELPYTVSREPLRRLAPFPWLASLRSTRDFLARGASPLELPYTLSREPLRRLAPFAWLASVRSTRDLLRAILGASLRSLATCFGHRGRLRPSTRDFIAGGNTRARCHRMSARACAPACPAIRAAHRAWHVQPRAASVVQPAGRRPRSLAATRARHKEDREK